MIMLLFIVIIFLIVDININMIMTQVIGSLVPLGLICLIVTFGNLLVISAVRFYHPLQVSNQTYNHFHLHGQVSYISLKVKTPDTQISNFIINTTKQEFNLSRPNLQIVSFALYLKPNSILVSPQRDKSLQAGS